MLRVAIVVLVGVALLWPEVASGRRRRRHHRRHRRGRDRVALVPIAASGRAARKLARKLTRKIWRRLRRRGRRRAILLSRRKVAKVRRCLQEPACVRKLGKRLHVKYFVSGYIMRARRDYNVDLAVISVTLGGVAVSRSFRSRSAWKVVAGGAAKLLAALRKAPRATKIALAKRKREKKKPVSLPPKSPVKDPDATPEKPALANAAGSGTEDPPDDATVKRDQDIQPEVPTLGGEEPVDPKQLLADQKKAASGASPSAKSDATRSRGPTFLTSVFSKRYWVGWLSLGAGAAALGTGIIFGLRSSSAVTEAEIAELQVDAWTARDKAQKNALAANLLFGVAGAAAITAGVLFYLEWRDERREHRKRTRKLVVDARWFPGGAGLGLSGRF